MESFCEFSPEKPRAEKFSIAELLFWMVDRVATETEGHYQDWGPIDSGKRGGKGFTDESSGKQRFFCKEEVIFERK